MRRCLFLAFFALVNRGSSLDNGLAITPQMGWNDWNAFACNVSEALVKDTAILIAKYGLRDLGYRYIVLDDCWAQRERGFDGKIKADRVKFPHGMTHLGDFLHGMDLSFGMYSDAGTHTCAKYPGSLGHEHVDAQQFAAWGVDYLKYDNCFNEGQSGNPLISYKRYKRMGDALGRTGRPILYSMCNWGEDYPWKWAQTIANSWRMSGDVFDTFSRPDARCPCTGDEGYNCAFPGFYCSAMNILDKVATFVDKGIPGAWNDLDSLEVGNGGMTDAQYVSHFSMWAIVKSPLVMGNDVRKMTPQTLSILSNAAVIAVNQDPLGKAAARRWRRSVNGPSSGLDGDVQMWSGPLSGGDYVVALLNTAGTAQRLNASLADIFFDEGPGGTATQVHKAWEMYDLWADRMSNKDAQAIISETSKLGIEHHNYFYNASQLSYSEGLSRRDPRLLGKSVMKIRAKGSLSVQVQPWSVKLYRLTQSKS